MEYETSTTKTNKGFTTTISSTRTSTSNTEYFSLEDDIGEIGALLDNSAAKHKISVRPSRGKRSPSIPTETKVKQEKEATLRELIETEEEFVRDLKYLITNYIRWIEDGTPDGRILAPHAQFLFGGLQEIHEFHKTVLLEGMKYYASQPNQIGRSFVRLERDFDKHAAYIDRLENIVEFLNENPSVNEAFFNRSIELNDTGRSLIDYVRLPSQRLNDYSLLLSDLVKICNQLGEPTNDLEKGLELVNWIPSKSRDIKFIQSIEGFGDTRVGRILRHDWFRLIFGDREKERYCFLFKNKVLVTKVRRISPDRSVFILKNILQLPELQLVDIERSSPPEPDQKEQGSFGLIDREGNLYVFQSEASIANSWAKDVKEFTSTRSLADEPAVKRGRIVAEVQESVTINGVEITDITSAQEDRSVSIDGQIESGIARSRVTNIPIQIESSDDTSLSERVVHENRKNTSKVDVVEIEHSISVDVKEEIIKEEEEGEKTQQSVDESETNNETVEEQKEIPSETAEFVRTTVQRSELITEDSEVPVKLTHTEVTETTRESSQYGQREITVTRRDTQSSQLVEDSQSAEKDFERTRLEREAVTDTAELAKNQTSEVLEDTTSRLSRSISRQEETSDVAAETRHSRNLSSVLEKEPVEAEGSRYSRTVSSTVEEQATVESHVSRTVSSTVEEEATVKSHVSRTASSAVQEGATAESRISKTVSSKAEAEESESQSLLSRAVSTTVEEESSATRLSRTVSKAETESIVAPPQSRLARTTSSGVGSEEIETTQSRYSRTNSSAAEAEDSLPTKVARQTSLVGESAETESKSKVSRTTSVVSEGEGVPKSSSDREIKPSKSTSSANLIRMESNGGDGDKPEFIRNVKSVQVEPGENATLTVETQSASPAIVSWLKENKPLEDRLADRVKIVSKNNTHSLTLLNASDEDSGLYTAKCSNQFGTTCSSGFINVHEFTPEERQQMIEERKPNFIVNMKDTELLLDTTVCFIVRPSGDPEPNIKFYKDSAPLKENERIIIGKTGDETELTILNVTSDDVGEYSCVAKNRYGEATTKAILTVTDEKTVFQGQEQRLLEPGEEPEFTWYRDGVKFSPEDKFKVLFKDDEDSLALVFQHVRPEDAGLYTCVASTSSGRISCSAELTVQGAIHQLLREPEAPVITAHLTDTEVSTGGSAMLELKVTGFPKPDVSWYKDGKEIQAGGRYRFLYEDDESIALIIKGVEIDDGGLYNVVAKNDLGEASTSGRLTVNSPPKFKAKMQDSACMTDEPFSMSVTVHGSPQPEVKWYKDGQIIIESERIQMTKTADGVFTITFEKIKMEDGGAYSVVASNACGQMSEFWNLVAQSRAKFTKKLESEYTVTEKETIEMSVEVSGNPEPEVKWLIDGKGTVGSGTSYSFKSTTSTDEKITVQCSNAFGTDECSADVHVLRGSKIKEGIKDTKVSYNSDAEFTIKVDEYPQGKVKWYIDGIEIDGKKYERKDDGDSHSLKIKGVTAGANIKVRAENEYGYDEQEARLDVIVKPTITRPLKESYTEVENHELKLSVDIQGNPEPAVTWYHNGEEVDADARIKIKREGTETWSLTFNVLLPSDSGDWTVKSKNEAGEAESKTVVIVEGKPEFEKKLVETVECVESDSVSFEVKVRGVPSPVIQWSLNKEELTSTVRTTIETTESRSTTTSKLVIKETMLEDAGVVTCVARNEHGECETTSQLIVQKSGPKLKLDASPRVVEAGKDLVLTALASDGAKIDWGVNGTKEKGKGSEFKLTPAQDCVVTVVASDGKTEERAEIPVRVMNRPKITGLSDVNAGPGETVTLAPNVESELDGLEVAWYRGDEKMKDCKEGDYSLTLPNLSQADAGKYTLVARNLVGETSASAKVNVLVEPPSFTRGLTDTKLREGEPLTLRVRVIGVPEPKVSWELDGKAIPVEGKDGTYEVAVESIALDQFGTYTVKAVNVAGEASTTAKVTLIEEKPIITRGPEKSKSADENEPITLTASVSGSPKPDVQWFKDGEPLKLEPGRVELSSGPGDTQKLVIAKAEKGDEGVYTLEAKNPVSVAKSGPSQVTVVPIPVLPTIKIDAPLEAEHGSNVNLKIEVDSQPEAKITLYENDKPIEPVRISRDGNSNVFNYVVKAPSRGDQVTYSAVAINSVGKGNDAVDVKLIPPPAAPIVIESLPADKTAVEGTPLKLQSVLSGSPLPKIQWLRDNVPVPFEIKEIDGKLYTAVVVDGISPAEAGEYKLVAENPSGTEEQKCQVGVVSKTDDSKPLEPPSFTTPLPDNILVSEGDDLVLTVGISGNPLPDIQWGRIADSGEKSTPSDAAGAGKQPGAGQPAATPDKAAIADSADTGKVPAVGNAGLAGPDTSAPKAAAPTGFGNAGLPPTQLIETTDAGAPPSDSGPSVDVAGKPEAGDTQIGDGTKVVPGHAGVSDSAKAAIGDSDVSGAAKPTAGDAGVGDGQKATAADAGEKGPQKATPAEAGTASPGAGNGLPGAGNGLPGAGNGLPGAGDAAAKDSPKLEPLKSILGPGVKVEESFDGKNATLRIPGVRQSLEGPISIQLSNPLGTKTDTINVGVRKVYSPAKIVDKFNDVHQVRGGDARFSAKVTGEPRPELEWFFEGKPLPADRSKYGTKWDGRTGSLTVYNVNDKDLGKYTLKASNIEGSDECSGILKELSGGQKPSGAERGEAPYFLKKIADAEFYEGMTVKFTACIGGIPEPEFHWFKDDMRIFPGNRISTENSENGLLRLIIQKAGPQDLGTYTLKIFNKYGEDQCKATCSIDDYQGRSGSATDSKLSASKPVGPPNPLPDKPIISSMTDRHLTLSWKPALRTHIDYPVTYTVEMAPANTNDWFTLRRGIKGCSTEVRNLEPGKDYKFRIRVENRVGVSEPSPYAQTLRYKFDWKPTPWTPPGGDYDLNRPPHPGFTHAPKFLNKNTEQYGVPGVGIGVEWWLYGYPKPSVTFFFNGEELSKTDHVFENNGRVVLYIDKLSESRCGWYECVGVNEHGEDRYRIHVLQGEHPKWIIRLDETHILERRDGKLSGVVTGRPQPEFKWHKDWNTLAETSRIKFSVAETDIGTYRVSCTLSDAIMKDHGLYSCAASNVVGTASSSANINIEEAEEEWRYKSYNKRLSPLSLKNKPLRDFYAFGDELGRGTQGIIRHAAGIQNGHAVSIKSMESGDAQKREWMRQEFNIHSDLFHPGITRVSDGYQDERGLHIVTDLCTGGDILSNCISRGGFSEHQVSDYMRQLLSSLDYLHNNKSVAHLGINPFDLLFSHEDGEVLKLTDFGLARRITSRLERLDFGHPEFASPEILNGEGAGFSSDLWSVGIITYLLLNGSTPFSGDNDLETINNVKRGEWELMNRHLSDNCQDFIRKLLVYDPRGRLDVRRAMEHPWISRYFTNSEKKASSTLTTYHSRLRTWYESASCRTIYRRNPWSGAYTHPSKMIYPPGEIDFEFEHSSRDTKTHVFGVPNYPRPDLNVEVGIVKSESHYTQGPDTYLLQLRDPDFPSRLRQYMKVAASRSPTFALQLKSQAYDRNNPIIRERRRFQDVMDEEVKDELTQGKEWRGEPRRLRHEVGIHLDTTAQADAIVALHKDGTPAFIREGPTPIVRGSIGDNVIIKCVVDGLPEPVVQWYKNDIVLGKTNRIDPTNAHLIIENFNETDFGLYKLMARNSAGSHTIKFRINQGHYIKPPATQLDYGIETNKIQVTQGVAGQFTELVADGNFGAWSVGTLSSSPGKLVKRIKNPVKELDTQISLSHSGLLNLKSVIADSESTYLVYNETTDDGYAKLTDKFIQEGVYNELDISNAVQQVLTALGYIQWRGLQLLNLSLDNILVDKNGHVKLVDTGSVARVAKIGSTLPIPETVTQFTAPEYLAGEAVYTTTDVWSIGCLVYTLLSGIWPFVAEDGKLTRGNIQYVRYRFEPLYSNSTPEATRFLMMIFKKCPMKRPNIEELQDSRWLSTQDSLIRRRTSASFKSLGLENLLKSSSFIIRNS